MLVLAGVLLVLAGGTPLQAQEYAGCWSLKPMAGYSMPMGDLGDKADGGIMGAVIVRYNVAKNYSLDMDVSYTHKLESKLDNMLDSGIDGKYGVFHVAVGNNFYVATGRVRPYGSAGLGLYSERKDLVITNFSGEFVDKGTDHRFGVNIGAGIEALVGDRAGIVADIKFHTANEDFRMVTFGIGLNYFLNNPYRTR